MILFTPRHVPPILEGIKTQTRRLGKCRWRVGSIHKCYTRPPFARGGAKPFASVRVLDVRQEFLRSISRADARAEGYSSVSEYITAFYDITECRKRNPLVWAVTFELVQEDEG